MIERLESRRLFAVPSATLAGGVLTIKGGSQADIITVWEKTPPSSPSTVHVELYEPGHGQYFFTQDYTGVTAINISVSKPATINHTGNRINPKITGSSSADNITVNDTGTGSSYIDAGAGDDSITVGISTVNPPGTSATTVHGGDGKDSIYVNTDTSNPNVATATSAIFGDKGDDTVTLYDGTNTVTGDTGNDKYIVLGGTNTITDAGGSNTYNVYAGSNTITGGTAVDTFFFNGGTNVANGNGGNDIFNTYSGSTNNMTGAAGTDTLNRHDNGGGTDTYNTIEKIFVVA